MPGTPALIVVPLVPTVAPTPRGPTRTLTPFFVRLSRTPGAIFIVLLKRNAMLTSLTQEELSRKMFRTQLAQALDPEMKSTPGLSKTNVAIVYLICLSILLGVLETEQTLTESFDHIFQIGYGIFLVVFGVEYVSRIWAAPENERYSSSLKYATTLASLTDLLVLISFLLPFFGLEAALLRMFRAARLVRLARLGRYSLAMQMIWEATSQRRYELALSVIIAFALMLLSSSALYLAERHIQPEDFGSIPRAMWWSVATLTTVGYGDIVPLTILGRICAAFTAITGNGLIALPTGILAGAFGEALRNIRSGNDTLIDLGKGKKPD